MFQEIFDHYLYTWKFIVVFVSVNVLLLVYNLQIIINCLSSHATGKKKNVLVTGCDSGFGLKAARELSASKVKVYAGCLTQEGVKRLQNDKSFLGVAFVMDVTKEEDVDKAYRLIVENTGNEGLSGVVNNAGILKPGLIDWQSINDMKKCMETNLWGAVTVTKTMLPLVKIARGRIVNVTSMAGRCWFGKHTAYSMSKFAFEAFSDGLRHEMKEWDVSVHIIEPGMFKTPILMTYEEKWVNLWESQSEEMKKAYGKEYFDEVVNGINETVEKLASHKIEKVTNAISHAVLSSNPKRRYVVGTDAWTIWMAVATLPTFMSDFIISIAGPRPIPAAMKKKDTPQPLPKIWRE